MLKQKLEAKGTSPPQAAESDRDDQQVGAQHGQLAADLEANTMEMELLLSERGALEGDKAALAAERAALEEPPPTLILIFFLGLQISAGL